MNQPKPEDADEIAAEFATRTFDEDEVKQIKKTRRRTPRLGEAPAEVYSFRAPPSYKQRIKTKAAAANKSESEIIRDALDAYLG